MTYSKKKKKKLSVSLLVDRSGSWIMPYIRVLALELQKLGHKVFLCHDQKHIKSGDLAFLLGCGRIVAGRILRRNKHNLVVHPSRLPEGRGFAPLAWQILEGKNTIPITLFEATESVDTGPIYLSDELKFEGHELNGKLRNQQGKKTVELVLRFVDAYPDMDGTAQKGKSSRYRRRTWKDSELDTGKSISELFNLLRIVDNKRYPAFFTRNGRTYVIKIYEAKNDFLKAKK